MAQSEQHGLIEELTRGLAPLRRNENGLASGPGRRGAPAVQPTAAIVDPIEGGRDPVETLGAVSAAMDAMNRQLDFLVTWLAADEGSRMLREIAKRQAPRP